MVSMMMIDTTSRRHIEGGGGRTKGPHTACGVWRRGSSHTTKLRMAARTLPCVNLTVFLYDRGSVTRHILRASPIETTHDEQELVLFVFSFGSFCIFLDFEAVCISDKQFFCL